MRTSNGLGDPRDFMPPNGQALNPKAPQCPMPDGRSILLALRNRLIAIDCPRVLLALRNRLIAIDCPPACPIRLRPRRVTVNRASIRNIAGNY